MLLHMAVWYASLAELGYSAAEKGCLACLLARLTTSDAGDGWLAYLTWLYWLSWCIVLLGVTMWHGCEAELIPKAACCPCLVCLFGCVGEKFC